MVENIRSQQKVGRNSLVKGYITKDWERTQTLWEQQTTTTAATKKEWSKELIIALHTFTYGTWKLQNEYEHGNSEHSAQTQRRQRLQKRIIELYNKPRNNLKKADLRHFNVPVQQRIHRSMEAMELWIVMLESIFRQQQKQNTRTLDTWLTLTTPEQNWKDRYKDNENTGMTTKQNTKNDF